MRSDGPAAAVWLADATGFIGSGFFLRQDLVLTVAHVLHRAEGPIHVRRGSDVLPGRTRLLLPDAPGSGPYYAYPDLGVVDVPAGGAATGVPPVTRLPSPGAQVVVHGYGPHTPEHGVQRDTLLLEVVGPAGPYLRLRGDEVRDGFSGAMVLTKDGSALVGVLKASRDFEGVRGGWCIPVTALWESLPADDPLLRELRAPASALGGAVPSGGSARPDQMLLGILESVPDIDDPDFRRRLIRAANSALPSDAPLQVPFSSQVRDHLFGLVEAARSHRDPARALWALTDAVDALRPGSNSAVWLREFVAGGG